MKRARLEDRFGDIDLQPGKRPIVANDSRSVSRRRTRLLFVNRSYWPDMEATGQLLTELCEGLAESGDFDVSVLCGQPNFVADSAAYRKNGSQHRNGVEIRRVRHTTFDKSSFAGRLANFVSFCWCALLSLMFGPRPDVIVCQTDPPLGPIAACLVAVVRRTRFICYLQDVYPDIAVQCGKLREGFAIKVLRKFLVWCYCRADKIVVVSNDMRDWLKNHRVNPDKVEVIQNWVDTNAIRPVKQHNAFRAEHLLEGKFVVMYSGNVGQTQRFDMLLDAAQRFQDDEGIVFMIVGGGVRGQKVRTEVKRRKLDNIRFLDYQPKSYLSESLSAADVQVVMLDKRMTQFMMPSKLYSALASGTPILGFGNPDSHLAEIIAENDLGWFFDESQLDDLVDQIRLAACDPELIRALEQNARRFSVDHCNRNLAVRNFQQLLAAGGEGLAAVHRTQNVREHSDIEATENGLEVATTES